jgi:hypothetical protein
MKTAGFHLLAFVAAGTLAAQELVAPAKTSGRLTEEIRASLPKYAPPPSPLLDQPHDTAPDPDLFALPKYTVKEKRPPSHDPDVWLTPRAIQQKAMAAYKQSMTGLAWALNSWFIPFVSPPASVRARAAYEDGKFRGEIERIDGLIARIARQDQAAAAGLRLELQNLATNRTPGSK